MTSASDKPDGWAEPVYEALVYPDSFYGARPRKLMLSIYAVGALAMSLFAIRGNLLGAAIALGAVLVLHVCFAILSRLEPFWSDVLGDWISSPKDRIEP